MKLCRLTHGRSVFPVPATTLTGVTGVRIATSTLRRIGGPRLGILRGNTATILTEGGGA